MKKHVGVCLLAGSVVFLAGQLVQANGMTAVPASRVAWHLVGRTLLDPATGRGQVLGYFTYIEGIPGPMFAGAPGESTAFFTLRSEPFSVQTFPNGDIVIGLLSPGTFRLYLDTTPDQDFVNPESFSDGQTLATLNRLPAQLSFVGPVFVDKFSTQILSARNFIWQDQKLNISRLTPNGVTLSVTGSTAFLPSGVIDFPVSASFGASGVAIERGRKEER